MHQQSFYLHSQQLTPKQDWLDGIEGIRETEKRDPRGTFWLVQVGVGMTQHVDDGIFLLAELKGTKWQPN